MSCLQNINALQFYETGTKTRLIEMGRTSFVVWLYIMGAACIMIAIGDRSWGWLTGALVFLVVATMARRQKKKEEESGREGVSIGFFVIAMLLMIAVIFFLYWLQEKA